MIINWKQNRVLVVTAKVGNGGVHTIVPGVNIIDDEAWNAIKGDLKNRIGKDIIEVKPAIKKTGDDGKVVNTTAKKPSDLEPKDAEELLLEVYSIPVLKEWLAEESRESVRAAIYRRITDLETPAAK